MSFHISDLDEYIGNYVLYHFASKRMIISIYV